MMLKLSLDLPLKPIFNFWLFIYFIDNIAQLLTFVFQSQGQFHILSFLMININLILLTYSLQILELTLYRLNLLLVQDHFSWVNCWNLRFRKVQLAQFLVDFSLNIINLFDRGVLLSVSVERRNDFHINPFNFIHFSWNFRNFIFIRLVLIVNTS